MAAVPRHSGLEPESRAGDVDSRLRGKDEEGALQAIFIVMTGRRDALGHDAIALMVPR